MYMYNQSMGKVKQKKWRKEDGGKSERGKAGSIEWVSEHYVLKERETETKAKKKIASS